SESVSSPESHPAPSSATKRVSKMTEKLKLLSISSGSGEATSEDAHPDRIAWHPSAIMDVRDWAASGKQHTISRWLQADQSSETTLRPDRSSATLIPVQTDFMAPNTSPIKPANKQTEPITYLKSPTQWVA